jgi:hypothetical protein
MTKPAGQKRRVLLLALAALAVGALSCDENSTAPTLTYPTTYAPLSALELSELTAKFEDQNPGLCETLDDYGFVKYAEECTQSGTPVTCPDSDRLVTRAKTEVVRNHLVTGVLHADELRLITSTCRDSLYSPRISMRFDNQLWQGLEVLGTYMRVHMNDDGIVYLAGHHYPQIFVPPPTVSSQKAEESLVGKTLTTGYPISHDYIVKSDSFVGEPFRVVYPYKVGDRIELRVAWSINVIHVWRIYVDSVTGEEIAVEDLIIY